MKIFKNFSNNILDSRFIMYFILSFITLSMIFSRSFLGLYIINFRVGEVIMAVSAAFLIFTILFNKYIIDKNLIDLIKILNITIIFFVVTALATNSSFLNIYTYKASSYIWSIGFLMLGIIFPKVQINSKLALLFLEAILITIFFVAVFDFPDWIINFFTNFSDKYEPHKGSDIVLNFILINVLFSLSKNNRNEIFELFLLNSSLFLPLILYKSRAAFIATMFFVLVQVFQNKKVLRVFDLKRVIVYISMIIIVIISTFISQKYVIQEFSESTLDQIPSAFKSLGEYKFSKYKGDYPFLYFSDQRVFSGDGNLNWRLQLWQDAIEDNVKSNSIIFGAGYKEKFTVFIEDNTGYGNDRRGLDGLNEHVHNYFLTIFLRGGLFQIFIFIVFYWKLFNLVDKKNKLNYLKFLLPILFVSLFDSSMENSHFPLIVYYFLGNQYIKN